MAHIRQSRPDSGIGFEIKLSVAPSSLGSSGPLRAPGRARLGMTLEPLLGSTALYRAVSWNAASELSVDP